MHVSVAFDANCGVIELKFCLRGFNRKAYRCHIVDSHEVVLEGTSSTGVCNTCLEKNDSIRQWKYAGNVRQ